VSADGRIYTTHPQETLIRVHDAEGRFVRTIGRQGEGPGEFSSLGSIGLLGDALWVLDHGLYRFSYFSLDGELLRNFNIPIDVGRTLEERPPRPDGLLSDGSIIASPPRWSRLVADGTITEHVALRMDEAGNVGDTLLVSPLANTILEIGEPDGRRRFASYRLQPFSDTEIAAISEYELATVRIDRKAAGNDQPTTFRVTKLTLEGDTVFSREFAYVPQRLEDALVDSIIHSIGESFELRSSPRAPTPARAEIMARDALYRPAFHPPVTALVFGKDGTLWLRREMLGETTVDWMILSHQGNPIGIVALPSGLQVRVANRGTVWGWETDELDVPYIVRMVRSEEAR
jgi:hypothetical protein